MASDQSKQTYTSPTPRPDASAGRIDRYFKTNRRLALEFLFPSCPHMYPRIHGPGSCLVFFRPQLP